MPRSGQNQSGKPKRDTVQKRATTDRTPAVEQNPFAVDALVSRVKADPHTLQPNQMLQLQRSLGNRAIAKLVQRHSIRQAPAPAPEEELQTKRADGQLVQRRFGHAPILQRHSIRQAPPPAQEEEIQTKRAGNVAPHQSAFGRGAPVHTSEQVQRAGLRRRGRVTFPQRDTPADGATTVAATAARLTGPITWSIVGSAYGSAIDATGNLTAGNALGAADQKRITVKAVGKNGYATGRIRLVEPKLYQARIDYPLFRTGGPYADPSWTTSNGFGNFGISYDPRKKRMDILVKLKFKFTDDAAVGGESRAAKARRLRRYKRYKSKFMRRARQAWSGRFRFKNIREPQKVWKKLNPVRVKVRAVEVAAGEHFFVDVQNKTAGRSFVTNANTATLKKGALDIPKQYNSGVANAKGTGGDAGLGELHKLKKILPSPVRFGANSSDIATVSAAAKKRLDFLAFYLRMLRMPKFNITIEGFRSAAELAGGTKKRVAARRARAIRTYLRRAGLRNHSLRVRTSAGTRANPDATLNAVVGRGFTNRYNISAHEFGHMLGLDDEYETVTGGVSNYGNATDNYGAIKSALGQDYADVVGKYGPDLASVMEGGRDVRVQHYVTFWEGLNHVTSTKAAVPATKFGQADWKFNV